MEPPPAPFHCVQWRRPLPTIGGVCACARGAATPPSLGGVGSLGKPGEVRSRRGRHRPAPVHRATPRPQCSIHQPQSVKTTQKFSRYPCGHPAARRTKARAAPAAPHLRCSRLAIRSTPGASSPGPPGSQSVHPAWTGAVESPPLRNGPLSPTPPGRAPQPLSPSAVKLALSPAFTRE